MSIIKAIKKCEYDFEVRAEKNFCGIILYLDFFSIFVGMPLIVLCAVCAITIVFAFPMSLLFGWI